jgi:hypothetical protein
MFKNIGERKTFHHLSAIKTWIFKQWKFYVTMGICYTVEGFGKGTWNYGLHSAKTKKIPLITHGILIEGLWRKYNELMTHGESVTSRTWSQVKHQSRLLLNYYVNKCNYLLLAGLNIGIALWLKRLATGWTIRVCFRSGTGLFLFDTASSLALEPTQRPALLRQMLRQYF